MQIKQGNGYRKYTYEQVAQHVHCLANALIRRGLRPGDRTLHSSGLYDGR